MSLTAAETLDRLRNSVKENRVAHAYLFIGDTEETDARVITPWLEMLLGCDPSTHPDVHRVKPSSKSRQIPIVAVRDLISGMNQTAFMGGWKIGIFYDVDRLNAQASNAFLKTLEEPAPGTLLILLSSRPEQLLPTILSRCLVVRLRGEGVKSPPDSLRPVLDSIREKRGRGAGAAYKSLVILNRHLASLRKSLEEIAEVQVAKARKEGLSGEGLELVEKELNAEAQSHYIRERNQTLVWLMESCVQLSPETLRLFEDARLALHRNVPESLVWDRLFLRLYGSGKR